MAVEIEARGRISSVYPANGKTFTITELVNLLGPSISIYELEGQSREDQNRAYYVVTIRINSQHPAEKNETVSHIYAPFMKGLADGAVYGKALVCTARELEPSEIEKLEMPWQGAAPAEAETGSWQHSA